MVAPVTLLYQAGQIQSAITGVLIRAHVQGSNNSYNQFVLTKGKAFLKLLLSLGAYPTLVSSQLTQMENITSLNNRNISYSLSESVTRCIQSTIFQLKGNSFAMISFLVFSRFQDISFPGRHLSKYLRFLFFKLITMTLKNFRSSDFPKKNLFYCNTTTNEQQMKPAKSPQQKSSQNCYQM